MKFRLKERKQFIIMKYNLNLLFINYKILQIYAIVVQFNVTL